jgi:hypothetical protein
MPDFAAHGSKPAKGAPEVSGRCYFNLWMIPAFHIVLTLDQPPSSGCVRGGIVLASF